jgi:alkylhydroperoxidase family enzyme
MPRVSEIEDDGGDATLKELFEAERERFGGLMNPTKIQAHCPPILRAAKQLGVAIAQSGLLPPALVALVSLRTAAINGCPF